MKTDPIDKTKEEAQSRNPQSPGGHGSDFVLQEMWSLQQEVLREILSGFRRLEDRQLGFEKALATQINDQTSHLQEVQATSKASDDFMERIDSRFSALSETIRELQIALHESLNEPSSDPELAARLQQQLVETREFIVSAVQESNTSVNRSLQENHIASRQQAEGSVERVREAVDQARIEVQDTVGRSCEDIGTVISGSTDSLESHLKNNKRDLQDLQEVISGTIRNIQEQTEGELQRISSEIHLINTHRKQLQDTLQNLTSEVHDVVEVAGKLESSSTLTQELLNEQRHLSQQANKQQRVEEARRFNNAGVLCYHQASYDASVDNFLKALEFDDTLAEAHNNLGLSYTEIGREKEATNSFQRALELDPTIGQVYNNLGYLYFKKGDIEKAVEMYEGAIQRSTDTSAAYTNLGNALYKLQRVDDAVTSWKRALEIDPGNNKAVAALERLGLETQS